VQDFDLSVQSAINRLQSFEATRSALDRLRAAGIRRSNIDLVYGLPLQTLDTLARTLDQAVALAPDRFAVFAYAHVPWMKAHQRLIDTASLPAAGARAAMAELVREKLLSAGYVQVGLDHFARPADPLARALDEGKLRRTFQGYVADESPWVIGIGASAISSLPRGHTQNLADTAAYMQAIEAGGFAVARGVAVDADDRLRGDIIGQLMCGYVAEVGDACRRHGVAPDAFFGGIGALDGLQRDGLVVVDHERLVVTDRGRPLVRSVCAAFDRYYTGAEGRHARGI
jgi:oxygen-independent coproporphyrinogen-3 oxidase